MKKLIACVLALFFTMTAEALPLGNPTDASHLTQGAIFPCFCQDSGSFFSSLNGCVGVKAGFYGDYVFNRHLKVSRNIHALIDRTKIFTNAGYLALNVCNRVEAFTTLGITKISVETPRSALRISGVTNTLLLFDSTSHFSWSLGLRGTLLEMGCFGIGGELQYFRTDPFIHTFQSQGATVSFFEDNQLNMRFQEWQIGLGISYRIWFNNCQTGVVPYAGIKWSRCSLDLVPNVPIPDLIVVRFFNLRESRDWGYAVGLTLIGCGKIEASVEARFVDETALHVNAQIRF